MQCFLRDNLSLSFASFEDDEISQELRRLLLPKLTHTGSLADTVSSNIHTSTCRGWTIDSIDCTLPKFSTWTPVQMDYAKELYVALYLYSVPVECIDIPQTCYTVVLKGKLFGSHKSRTALLRRQLSLQQICFQHLNCQD